MISLFWLVPFTILGLLIAAVFCAYKTGFKEGEEYGRLRSEMEIPLNLRRHQQ